MIDLSSTEGLNVVKTLLNDPEFGPSANKYKYLNLDECISGSSTLPSSGHNCIDPKTSDCPEYFRRRNRNCGEDGYSCAGRFIPKLTGPKSKLCAPLVKGITERYYPLKGFCHTSPTCDTGDCEGTVYVPSMEEATWIPQPCPRKEFFYAVNSFDTLDTCTTPSRSVYRGACVKNPDTCPAAFQREDKNCRPSKKRCLVNLVPSNGWSRFVSVLKQQSSNLVVRDKWAFFCLKNGQCRSGSRCSPVLYADARPEDAKKCPNGMDLYAATVSDVFSKAIGPYMSSEEKRIYLRSIISYVNPGSYIWLVWRRCHRLSFEEPKVSVTTKGQSTANYVTQYGGLTASGMHYRLVQVPADLSAVSIVTNSACSGGFGPQLLAKNPMEKPLQFDIEYTIWGLGRNITITWAFRDDPTTYPEEASVLCVGRGTVEECSAENSILNKSINLLDGPVDVFVRKDWAEAKDYYIRIEFPEGSDLEPAVMEGIEVKKIR